MKLGTDLLWLSEDDVASLLTMKEALGAVESAFALHGEGKVQMPSKLYLSFDPFEGDLRAMPAFVKSSPPAAGVKIVNSNPANPGRGLPAVSGIMVLVDPETGLPLAILGAGNLTAIRTGAAGGVAAKYLARPKSRSAGLIGCGRQALTQLEALQLIFPIETCLVWGKTREEAESFCANAPRWIKAGLKPCSDVEEACRADILVTTTPVRTPLVKEAWVAAGTHVNAIGADAPGKQELETSLVKKARVVVDDWLQASHAGEINVPVAAGVVTAGSVAAQLGEIVIGRKKGRLSGEDITIFDSTGLALQDVAVGRFVYEKALKQSKGQALKIHG
jgi:alanine dehydrogenase